MAVVGPWSAWRRRRPEGSTARTEGKLLAVRRPGKRRGGMVRSATRGGAGSAREKSAAPGPGGSSAAAADSTRGTLPRMTHEGDGDGNADAADAIAILEGGWRAAYFVIVLPLQLRNKN